MFFELRSSSTMQLGKPSISQVWQRKYKPGRLPQKVISSLVIGSLVLIVGGIAFTSYWIVRSLIIKNLEEKALIEVERTSHEIDEWLAFMIFSVETLANNSSVRSMKWRNAEAFLKQELKELSDYHMFLMASTDGDYYTTNTGFVKGKNVGDRAYFQQAIAGQANVSDFLISRSTGVRQVSIAIPIRTNPSTAQNLSTNPILMRLNNQSNAAKIAGKPIGVLAGLVPVDRITEAVSHLRIGQGSYAFVLDSQGVPITYPNRLYIQDPKSFLNEPNPTLAKIAKSMVNRQREVQLVQLEGKWVYVAYAPLKFTNWSVGLAIPKENLEEELTALNLLASVVGSLLVVATIAAGWQLQLFEKTKESAAQEAMLNRITARIRASLDLETILQTTVDEVAQLLCLDRVMFSWYRVEKEMLEVVCEHRRQEMPSHLGYFDVKNLENLVGSLRNCEIIKDDVFNEPGITKTVGEIGSYVALPVLLKTSERGYLTCIRTSPWNWGKREIELLRAVTDQLAIAINQSRLLAQTEAQVKIANEQAFCLTKTLKQLQKTQAQLIQSEKMSSLGQLVAGVAHEINNPTSFIYGNIAYAKQYSQQLVSLLQLYQQHYPHPVPEIQAESETIDLNFILDDLPKLLSSMQSGADRIRKIVLSLRNFSRLEQSEMKAVDIHEGIDNTLVLLQHRLHPQTGKPKIQVIKEYGKLPWIECSAAQMNQVFMNILSNAIDALEQGKVSSGIKETATYQLSITNYQLPTIHISTAVTRDNCITIRIADNGQGMTESVKKHIFDPFFTTKPVGQGTGLGLAISYQIVVEKHGGNLLFYSEPGRGTELWIEIPICQSKKHNC